MTLYEALAQYSGITDPEILSAMTATLICTGVVCLLGWCVKFVFNLLK